jgi:aerobic C4-dicarboxylate transport protein
MEPQVPIAPVITQPAEQTSMETPPRGFELHDMRCAKCPDDVPVTAHQRTPWYKILYVQVLVAIVLGVIIGYFFPHTGVKLKPLGDVFVGLIKMMIAPVIFCTIVHGIASMSDLKSVGRVAVKALIYFEVVSTLALAIGLIVGEIVKPGRGFNIDPATLDPRAVASYVTQAKQQGFVAHLLAIVPESFFGALAKGDILQVLLVSILTGVTVAGMGSIGERITSVVAIAGKMFFRIIGIIVRFAPVGAFGAMAFTIGSYGVRSLINLGALIATFYGTSLLFVLLVLGLIARLSGFSILRFIGYIKDELLIVLGTSSSETVLPRMIQKMENLGAPKSIVGLVVPTGYSFNLDGTNIYMTLATLFLAQATNTHLTLGQEFTILAVAILTSKGASGVTGAGFVTLAATLSIIPGIPLQSIAILLGIDKFMSETRALTNTIGNGVATIVVSRWEHQLDAGKLKESMAHPIAIGEELETSDEQRSRHASTQQ